MKRRQGKSLGMVPNLVPKSGTHALRQNIRQVAAPNENRGPRPTSKTQAPANGSGPGGD